MDESSESPGLKIAVSAFISISVILGVAVYFLYSNQAVTQAKLAAANDVIRQLQQANRQALAKDEELKKDIHAIQQANRQALAKDEELKKPSGAGKSEARATKGEGTDPAGHRPR